MRHTQPAEPSYFFHGGFIDLRNVISDAFRNCGGYISQGAKGVSDAWGKIINEFKCYTGFFDFIGAFIPNLFLFGFFFTQLLFTAVITPLICISVTIVQIIILSVLFFIVFVGFVIITLIDWIYCCYNKIASHCPICQSKYSLPIYICPGFDADNGVFCGAEHDRLRPGYYGIFRRKCNCGEKLPTTFLNGRQKLKAVCPDCKAHGTDSGGLHASWSIPVIGGPNSGKTCYINMTMMSLEKNALSEYGLTFEHVKTGRDEYEKNSQFLSYGSLPQKTADDRLNYYQFYLTPEGATKQQISLCDVAGELFNVNYNGINKIDSQMGFRYGNAFMLIVDPLSISNYRKEISKTIDVNKYDGSAQPIDEMLGTFIETLQNMFGVAAKDILNTNVAVVFTKMDIPGLAQKIGVNAVLKDAPSHEQKVKYKTQNDLCEQFLREYGENNFLLSLKSRFKCVQFFTCSALGHVMNGQPFVASNVEEPLFWLLRKQSAVINKAIKQTTIQGGKK